MPSIVVAQLGIGRPDVGGHDRPEVAAPDRGEVAAGEAGIVGAGGRPTAANPLTIVGRVRSSRSSTPAGRWRSSTPGVAPATQRAEQGVGEPADPEERRVREQHLVGLVAAELVEVVEVADQRRRAVWITPFGALVEPDVWTMTMRSAGGDLGLGGGEHGVVDRGAGVEHGLRRSTPAATPSGRRGERDRAAGPGRRRDAAAAARRGRARRWPRPARRRGSGATGRTSSLSRISTSAPRSSPASSTARRERAERDRDRADAGGGQPADDEVARRWGAAAPTCVPWPAPVASRPGPARPSARRRRRR